MRQSKCIECGMALVGRSDKKFCSDVCRNSYNNNLNKEKNRQFRKINKVLYKNRAIINELIKENCLETTKEDMQMLGFNFHYFTQLYATNEGKRLIKCYDLSFYEKDGQVEISTETPKTQKLVAN